MNRTMLYTLALSVLLAAGCAMTDGKMDSTMTPAPMTDESGEMMMDEAGEGMMMKEGGMMDDGMEDMEGMKEMKDTDGMAR